MKKLFSKKISKIVISLLFASFILVYILSNIKNTSATDSQDRIHFIKNSEVGSDAIVIESNGHCGLVDSMNPSTDSSVAIQHDGLNFLVDNGTKVKTYIQGLGCNYLDFYIMSHNHTDHIGGSREIMSLINSNTIVFYKKDVVSRNSSNQIDDLEEELGWYNHEYLTDAVSQAKSKNAKTCDVSANNSNPEGDCYLASLHNSFISGVSENNNTFSDYDTNMDWTYYFDFGDFKINLYNLFILSQHRENFNSIATLVTHKTGGTKTMLMADLETRRGDIDEPELDGRSNIMLNPTGNCEECTSRGLENQMADIIGKVDVLKAAHHGNRSSNSYYMINKFQPKYYITTKTHETSGNNVYPQIANTAAVAYMYREFGTISYYTSQSDGAVVIQLSDSSNNPVIKNYNASGQETNHLMTNVALYIPERWYYINNVNGQTEDQLLWVYAKNNTLVTGWNLIEDKWYYFDEHGIMKTGWYKDDLNNWYYLCKYGDNSCSLGEMITGYKNISNSDGSFTYYFRTSNNDVTEGSKGSMVKGLVTISNETHYFRTQKDDVTNGPEGSMLKNACVISNNTYYCFDSSGNLSSNNSLINPPTCKSNLVYSGSSQELISPNNTYYTLSNNSGTNAGNYTVTASLKAGYAWSDQSLSNKNIECSIGKANLTVPQNSVVGFTGDYDGQSHSVSVSPVVGASIKYSLDQNEWTTNNPAFTNVGTNQVYVKYIGDSNHFDSSIYQTNVIINQASPTLGVTLVNESIIQNNEEIFIKVSSNVAGTLTLSSSNENVFTTSESVINLSANTQSDIVIRGITVGSATLIMSFAPSNNNYSSLNRTEPVTIVDEEKIPVDIPTGINYCKQDLKYTGSYLTITNEPEVGYTFSNNYQKDVGTYPVTATLDKGYKWSDNTTSNKTINCSIYNSDTYFNPDSSINVNNDTYIISKITQGMTYLTLKNKLNTNGTITTSKTNNDIVSTCDALSITLDSILYNYTLVVTGDINKKGTVEQDDVDLLFKYLRNKATLTNCQIKAADTTNDNELHINDVAKLYQYVNHKIEGLDD